MSESPIHRIVETVESGAKLLRQWPLSGGISCSMTGIELERSDGTHHKLTIRQVGKWSYENYPESVQNEFGLLNFLRENGIRVARPRLFDLDPSILGRPYLVLNYVEGSTDLTTSDRLGRAEKMADQLAEVHLLDVGHPAVSFMKPSKVNIRPANNPMDEMLQESKSRAHLEALLPTILENEYTIRHGDFWPGNVLWQNGELAAVIDWEETSIGDPLFDVALSRLDILWAYGVPAMNAFTQRYQAKRDISYDHLPFWDLRISLRPLTNIAHWASSFPSLGRQDVTAELMTDGHRWFVDQAIENLGRP